MKSRTLLGISLILASPVCAGLIARQQYPIWIGGNVAMLLAMAGIRLVTSAVRQ
jgi:hypothetical protein